MVGLFQTSLVATGSWFRPLWLLFGTPSAFRSDHELVSRRGSKACPLGCHSIYSWYIIFISYFVCVLIFMPSCLLWLLVCCLYKEVYLQKKLNACPFDCKVVAKIRKWARTPVNHTSWVAVVTQTGRPKSVRNRRVIERFCGVAYVVTLPFWQFCWYMGFCHTCRTESDLSFVLILRRWTPFIDFTLD